MSFFYGFRKCLASAPLKPLYSLTPFSLFGGFNIHLFLNLVLLVNTSHFCLQISNKPKMLDNGYVTKKRGKTMTKELKKLMKKNKFTLIRQKKHLVWEHITGGLVTTSSTPSCQNALRNIKQDIKSVVGACYA